MTSGAASSSVGWYVLTATHKEGDTNGVSSRHGYMTGSETPGELAQLAVVW